MEQYQLKKDLADLGNLRYQVSLGMPWFCDLGQHLSLLNLFLRLLSSQNLPLPLNELVSLAFGPHLFFRHTCLCNADV